MWGLFASVWVLSITAVAVEASFTTRPSNQIVIENATVTFHCNATGDPTPKITWTKDDKILGEGNTLIFVAYRNQSGEYKCTADSGKNSTINASASLDVQYPPSFTSELTDQTVIEGELVKFRCDAAGNPPPDILWIKDGRTVDQGQELSLQASRELSGKYWCSVQNSLGISVNISAELDVQFPPTIISAPKDKTIIEGASVTFHCNATGNPPARITWMKDGKTVSSGNVLTFKTSRNQSGEYWCTAENGLNSTVNASTSLDVQFPPKIISRPSNQTVLENEEVKLHCAAIGNPIPKILWIKDGITIGTGGNLMLKAWRNASGTYTCMAKNLLNATAISNAHVDILYPPSLTTRPADQTAIEFSQAKFICNATGNPTPKITWTKDGKIVESGSIISFLTNRNDSGQYWCTADNGLNLTVNASANLEVQFLPSFIIEPNDQTVIEMGIATFKCSATGNPLPKVTWIKDGITVASGDTLSFVAYRNKSGQYWCSADNGLGQAENSSARLYVHFKPEKTRLTINTDITKPVQFGSFVTFNCTTHARPDPDGYKFYRGQELLSSSSGSGVFDLRLQRSGLYSCLPFNSAGDGDQASLKIIVDVWKPSFDRLFGPFYLFKGTQGRLPCKPIAEPYPNFRWFKDGVPIGHEQNESYTLDADGSLLISNVKDGNSGRYTCMAENYLGTANATANAIVLERTQIVVKPKNYSVSEGASVDLHCKATVDPSLELIYVWKRDGADIIGNLNIVWLEEENVLRIKDITFQETGVYTCLVYTPKPRGSEDSASAIVSITGVPLPPTRLELTECYNRRTNLSWTPVISNSAKITTHYLIEQETNHEPNVFKIVYNITNPGITSVSLTLPGWSSLRFRVRTANDAGPSRPSETTERRLCITPVGAPSKYPSNVRGVATKANELSITWDPLPKTEWDAPGFYYIVKFRKVNSAYVNNWRIEKIGDPKVNVFPVTNAGYYQPWEFTIRAGNHEGLGPECPMKLAFSGQDAPVEKPKSTNVEVVTATTATIAWKPVTVMRGNVDGYKIYYWGESRAVSSRRRRGETIPSAADVITVTDGKTQKATLTGLKPITNYQVIITAFNNGGEGPLSDVLVIETLEGEPGPPSDVRLYPFGQFILVTWKPPKEPNGMITDYQVGYSEYNSSYPKNVSVSMETVERGSFKKLLGNLTFETSYVVVLQARTSKGWGESYRETTRTIKRMAPAKPDRPTVVETGKHVVSLKYNYGIGGGWTHQFKVLYRKQVEGGEFLETQWIDHFSTQLVKVNSLDTDVYEFKTVGKNFVGTSPESDVIEARPEPDPLGSSQRGNPTVYGKDWFIILMILSACTLILLIIVILYKSSKRRRSSSLQVAEDEKEKGKEKIATEIPEKSINPRQEWLKRIQDRVEVESQADSLDEYGGDGAYFSEDGSFIGDCKQGGKRQSVYEEIPLDDPVV